MSADRILYRTRQFWHALGSVPSDEDMLLAETVLTAPQLTIFRSMSRNEQAHGLRVLQTLQDMGEQNTDLLRAALLHDSGKSRYPLRLWERVTIVLANRFVSQRAQQWGERPPGEVKKPQGWRRAFIIAEEHPLWGAEIAARAGSSAMTVNLIRRHQDQLEAIDNHMLSLEDHLLSKLQAADNES
jgi:hypothetical protein